MDGEQNIALPGYVSFNHEHRERHFFFIIRQKASRSLAGGYDVVRS